MSDEWTPERLSKLLEYLPQIEDPDFVAATWPDRGTFKGAIVMPYPDYHPIVYPMLAEAVGLFGDRNPYDRLPEDPPGVEPPLLLRKPEDFETASAAQVLRFFFLTSRGERFSDGHIDSQFLNGNVVAALRRLSRFMEQT